MSVALNIYHRLPPASRTVVASVRGYYLGWWRYDRQTEKLVEEALERDYWTEEQWEPWRQERLASVLFRAATQVPYYRDLWTRRRRSGDKASYEYLENWPILEKQVLRERALELVADDCTPKKMFRDHTSGTTGTSLDIWMTRETVKYWYALAEARWRRWYGVARKDRWAILGGQLVAPIRQSSPPFWVWNAGLNQLYMSSYHLAPRHMKHYIQALKDHRVRYMVGYSSALYTLAQWIVREHRTAVPMDVVITNAEPLYEHQKETISEAFGCRVMETYGMAEMVAAASECSSGSLHQWPEAGVTEQVGDYPNADFHDLVCTGLVNVDMPLIRYRVGDSGTLSNSVCDCGRKLPVLGKIEGRIDDLLLTADGRDVGRLDPVFKDAAGIAEAQIIQKSLNNISVRFVPAPGFEDRVKQKIADRIRERMGKVDVAFQVVDEIPRTVAGKFRAVVSELSNDEKKAVRKRLSRSTEA